VTFSRDALLHQSNLSYADSFSDGNNSRNTFAYPTTATDPGGFNSLVQYNFDFGAVTRTQGPPPAGQTQGRIQSILYDAAARVQRVTTVNNGGYIRYTYGPYYQESFATVNNIADEAYAAAVFDGLGRTVATARNHPGSVGGYSGQLTVYDLMGRVMKQSNPTETSAIAPSWVATGDDAPQNGGYGWLYTQQTYDWNSRPLRTTHPDTTYREASYGGCGCAGGEVVTLTDEGTIDGGVAKRRQQKIYADVLGRTIKVEVLNWAGGSVYSATVNTYNVRDQVTQVRQYAGAEGSGTYQDTVTTYDGFGRLKTRHVPEQNAGTSTVWDYYADDTVQKVTDARGAWRSLTYNSRHLVTGVSFGAPTGSGITVPPAVGFGYDAAGNRTSMTDGGGITSYQLNQLSQITSETRSFAGLAGSFSLSYEYNLAGELKKLTDHTGMAINYGYNTAGRINGVSGSGNLYGGVSQYASAFAYRAWNGLKQVTDGSNHTASFMYNARMQTAQYQLSGGAVTQTFDY
jgi:YD repeat-containing protein